MGEKVKVQRKEIDIKVKKINKRREKERNGVCVSQSMLTPKTEDIMNRPVFINDMTMLAVLGGRERSPSDVDKLLARSGFSRTNIYKVWQNFCSQISSAAVGVCDCVHLFIRLSSESQWQSVALHFILLLLLDFCSVASTTDQCTCSR